MKYCKAELSDGKPCTNEVDEGQEYCPYHHTEKITLPKKIFSGVLAFLGVVASVLLLKGEGSSKN